MKTEYSRSKVNGRDANGSARWQPLRSYRDLEAYRRSMDLQERIDAICRAVPREERTDLAGQMARASKSIPTNIAQGFDKKKSEKQFKQYMKTAMASAGEMEEYLNVAAKLGYVRSRDLGTLVDGYTHVGEQVNRLIANWRHF